MDARLARMMGQKLQTHIYGNDAASAPRPRSLALAALQAVRDKHIEKVVIGACFALGYIGSASVAKSDPSLSSSRFSETTNSFEEAVQLDAVDLRAEGKQVCYITMLGIAEPGSGPKLNYAAVGAIDCAVIEEHNRQAMADKMSRERQVISASFGAATGGSTLDPDTWIGRVAAGQDVDIHLQIVPVYADPESALQAALRENTVLAKLDPANRP